MCGRYTLIDRPNIATRFGLLELGKLETDPRFNVAPSQQVPVVVETPSGRGLRLMRWGFQPAWMKDPRRPPPINARAETLVERPLFRGAVAHGRCLIPADGFYEWSEAPGRKGKQPMYLRLKGGELFGFAGLHIEGPDAQETCAIITTAANEVVAPVHHRMPVILDPEDERLWLDPAVTDPAAALACLRSRANERLEFFPVGPLVSSAQNEGPALIERLPHGPT
jgi:putative SOS response-associated peptidase YedK